MKPMLAAIVAATLGLSPFSASADKPEEDVLIAGAKLCTRYLPRHERQFGIPEHLLAAIASTESGRFHRALGLNLPWPWTINVEGQGHFYDTKEQAIEAVKAYQARGYASIDVGCMQVNLQHHPDAFATLDQAFDPAYNVSYAAQFLKKNFAQEGSWRKATADYHSRTIYYGEQYARLVYGAWSRIINKVADARSGRPIMTAAVPGKLTPSKVRVVHPVRMHDISVASDSHDTTRENGVLIVRPNYGSQATATPQPINSAEDNFVIHPEHRESVRTSDKMERSAIAPDGVALASAGADVGRGAQIVKVSADAESNTKGQFEPSSARVFHAHGPDASASASSSGASAQSAGASNSPFVFQ